MAPGYQDLSRRLRDLRSEGSNLGAGWLLWGTAALAATVFFLADEVVGAVLVVLGTVGMTRYALASEDARATRYVHAIWVWLLTGFTALLGWISLTGTGNVEVNRGLGLAVLAWVAAMVWYKVNWRSRLVRRVARENRMHHLERYSKAHNPRRSSTRGGSAGPTIGSWAGGFFGGSGDPKPAVARAAATTRSASTDRRKSQPDGGRRGNNAADRFAFLDHPPRTMFGTPGAGLSAAADGGSFSHGSASAGQRGERELAALLHEHGHLARFTTFWSLKMPDKSGRGSPDEGYRSDIDCVVLTRHRVIIIDAKLWKDPTQTDGDLGGNVAMAYDRVKAIVDRQSINHEIDACVVFLRPHVRPSLDELDVPAGVSAIYDQDLLTILGREQPYDSYTRNVRLESIFAGLLQPQSTSNSPGG